MTTIKSTKAASRQLLRCATDEIKFHRLEGDAMTMLADTMKLGFDPEMITKVLRVSR